MMKKALKRDNRGLTLVELIVGVVILALIVTPLLHVFVTGANTVKKTKQISDANVAAKNLIEEIEAKDMSVYLSGLSRVTDEHSADKGKYVISKDVSSGGSDFKAKIMIGTENPLNNNSIPFSNQMDGVFQMQDTDGTALALFHSSGDTGFTRLKRYVTIDAENMDGSSICKVTVTFEYSGTAKKEYLDGDGNTRFETVPFNYSTKAVMNITPRSDTGTAFSVFLFFKAYKSTDADFQMGKTVINNKTKDDAAKNWKSMDFNVFLVDVGDSPADIKTEVDYKPTTKGRKVNLMTNMKNTTYKVYTLANSIWQTPKDVPVNLVQTEAIDRVYSITVEIYKGEKKITDLTTSKLDYSAQ